MQTTENEWLAMLWNVVIEGCLAREREGKATEKDKITLEAYRKAKQNAK